MFLLVEDTMQRVAAGRELLDLVDILDPGLSIFRGKGNLLWFYFVLFCSVMFLK